MAAVLRRNPKNPGNQAAFGKIKREAKRVGWRGNHFQNIPIEGGGSRSTNLDSFIWKMSVQPYAILIFFDGVPSDLHEVNGRIHGLGQQFLSQTVRVDWRGADQYLMTPWRFSNWGISLFPPNTLNPQIFRFSARDCRRRSR